MAPSGDIAPTVSAPRTGRARLYAGAFAALLALCVGSGAVRASDPSPPVRVVSINLCTDLLALQLAGPGQLVSVSALSQDPSLSPMADAAAALPGNSARAEELFLLRPDLVLAGPWSNTATLDMMRRLGIPVETFTPATALADIPDQLRRMGAILGRPEAGEDAAAAFSDRLARLAPPERAPRPRAALWFANGFTGTDRSLSGQILASAGFANIASELDLPPAGMLALEALILSEPDLVVTGRPYRGHSHGEELLTHPALDALGAPRAQTTRNWVCDTPHLLDAVAALAEIRRGLTP